MYFIIFFIIYLFLALYHLILFMKKRSSTDIFWSYFLIKVSLQISIAMDTESPFCDFPFVFVLNFVCQLGHDKYMKSCVATQIFCFQSNKSKFSGPFPYHTN